MSRKKGPFESHEFPKKVKIFAVLLAIILLFGTIGFKFLENLSFSQAFLRVLETLAFMFQAKGGLNKGLEIFLAIFGVFLVWWILWSFFDLLFEGNFTEYLKIRFILNKLKKMRVHYIIAGGGRVGEEIATKLYEKKQKFVIIERDENTVNKLNKKGFFSVVGDVTDDAVLKKLQIEKAKAIILALPETEKNLLLTITAKELNPKIEVYARADKPSLVSKLKKAGAKVVIVPEIIAADEIVKEVFKTKSKEL